MCHYPFNNFKTTACTYKNRAETGVLNLQLGGHRIIIQYIKYTEIYLLYVSESDILGPNDNLSDIKNLVSFERELFEDSGYKYRIKIILLFMSISPL